MRRAYRSIGSVLRRATMVLSGVAVGGSAVLAQGAATHSSQVWSVTFARNESSVATTAKGEVRLWALPSGQLLCRFDGNFYGADMATDGESGYRMTMIEFDRRGRRAIQAFRVDSDTCGRVATPVVEGAVGSSTWAQAPDGRILPNGFVTAPDSPVSIRYTSPTFVVEVRGGVPLESELKPSVLDAGQVIYACTRSKKKLTYHRIVGDRRIEKLGDSDPDEFGHSSCGPLVLSADSSMLFNLGDGAVVDLQQKRILVAFPVSQPNSMGLDAARQRLTIGSNSGALTIDVRSRKLIAQVRDQSDGYTSLTGRWLAVSSMSMTRPVVTVRGTTGSDIVLDDARSRPAADARDASREAEIRAREAADRRERERVVAAREAERVFVAERNRRFLARVTAAFGTPTVFTTLRQVQYQGAYEMLPMSVAAGDVLVLLSEYDGVVGYSISDGRQQLSGEKSASDATSGFQMVHSTLTGTLTGTLLVSARGSPVYVFLVPKANVK